MKMKPIACLFGSESDARSADEIKRLLTQAGFSVDIYYLSAHRAPNELRDFLAFKAYYYQALIGAAGLAAHLAGTMAAQGTHPVFGWPLKGAFSGLDSFLATAQMPKGIPVLTCGVQRVESIVHFLQVSQRWDDLFAVSLSPQWRSHPLLEKNQTLIADLGVEIFWEEKPSGKFARLEFVDLSEVSHQAYCSWPEANLTIPLLKAEQAERSELATKFFELSLQGGIWVGTNRFDNALLGLARLRESWRTPRQKILMDYKEGRKK